MTRAWRARLSLTPDETDAVHKLVDGAFAESEDKAFWGKLLDKVKRANQAAVKVKAERSEIES